MQTGGPILIAGRVTGNSSVILLGPRVPRGLRLQGGNEGSPAVGIEPFLEVDDLAEASFSNECQTFLQVEAPPGATIRVLGT